MYQRCLLTATQWGSDFHHFGPCQFRVNKDSVTYDEKIVLLYLRIDVIMYNKRY